MRRLLITTTVCCLLQATALSANPLADAQQTVNRFYRSLQYLVSNQDGDEAFNAKKTVKSLFPDDDFRMPNEFPNMGQENEYNYLRVPYYVNRLMELGRERDIRMTVTGLDAQMVAEPEFRKGEGSYNFVLVKATKTYQWGKGKGETFPFHDELVVNLSSMQIVCFYNEAHPADQQLETEATPGQLKARAALSFEEGNYDEAYRLYEKVVVLSNDGDAYYRLAIMSFRKQGCRSLSGKTRRQNTMTYLKKAQYYGNSGIKALASNMLYWVS